MLSPFEDMIWSFVCQSSRFVISTVGHSNFASQYITINYNVTRISWKSIIVQPMRLKYLLNTIKLRIVEIVLYKNSKQNTQISFIHSPLPPPTKITWSVLNNPVNLFVNPTVSQLDQLRLTIYNSSFQY